MLRTSYGLSSRMEHTKVSMPRAAMDVTFNDIEYVCKVEIVTKHVAA